MQIMDDATYVTDTAAQICTNLPPVPGTMASAGAMREGTISTGSMTRPRVCGSMMSLASWKYVLSLLLLLPEESLLPAHDEDDDADDGSGVLVLSRMSRWAASYSMVAGSLLSMVNRNLLLPPPMSLSAVPAWAVSASGSRIGLRPGVARRSMYSCTGVAMGPIHADGTTEGVTTATA